MCHVYVLGCIGVLGWFGVIDAVQFVNCVDYEQCCVVWLSVNTFSVTLVVPMLRRSKEKRG